MASAQDTSQTQALSAAFSSLKRKRTGVTPPPDHKGCACKSSECATKYCPCHKHEYGCTSKCTCRRCENIFGIKGSDPDTGLDMNELPPSIIEPEQAGDTRASDSNTEPGQGSTGGLSNVPAEAVQITPSSNIDSEQADDASSMAREPPQGGFDSNNLP